MEEALAVERLVGNEDRHAELGLPDRELRQGREREARAEADEGGHRGRSPVALGEPGREQENGQQQQQPVLRADAEQEAAGETASEGFGPVRPLAQQNHAPEDERRREKLARMGHARKHAQVEAERRAHPEDDRRPERGGRSPDPQQEAEQNE